MEDFKQIHAALRIRKMTCIERNPEVIKRQKFNNPLSGVVHYPGLSGDFITDFERTEPIIVWLDYTASDTRKHITELADLLGRLAHGDVFKITLNAHPNTLEKIIFKPGDPAQLQHRKDIYESSMQEFFPLGTKAIDFSLDRFPSVINKSVRLAIEPVFLRSPLVAVPLTSFAYKDGQQMYTFCGIVLERNSIVDFYSSTRIRSWEFSTLKWEEPQKIQVPDLSIKERQHLEGLLPDAAAIDLSNGVGFQVHDESSNSIALLDSLKRYYRFMPHYSRIAF